MANSNEFSLVYVVTLAQVSYWISQMMAGKRIKFCQPFVVPPDDLFVRVCLTDAAAAVVGQVKGVTSRILRQEFSHLLRLPSLWTKSYFASTAGNVSATTIQRYIEAQKGL